MQKQRAFIKAVQARVWSPNRPDVAGLGSGAPVNVTTGFLCIQEGQLGGFLPGRTGIG